MVYIRSFPSGAKGKKTTRKCPSEEEEEEEKEGRRMEQPLDTLASALCYTTRTARKTSPLL